MNKLDYREIALQGKMSTISEHQGESVSLCLSPHALLTYSFSALGLQTTHIITNVASQSAGCSRSDGACRFSPDGFFFLMMEAYFLIRGTLLVRARIFHFICISGAIRVIHLDECVQFTFGIKINEILLSSVRGRTDQL